MTVCLVSVFKGKENGEAYSQPVCKGCTEKLSQTPQEEIVRDGSEVSLMMKRQAFSLGVLSSGFLTWMRP